MATTEPNGRFEGKVTIAVERSVVHRDEQVVGPTSLAMVEMPNDLETVCIR